MSIQPNPDNFLAVKTREVTPVLGTNILFSSVLARRNARSGRRANRAI